MYEIFIFFMYEALHMIICCEQNIVSQKNGLYLQSDTQHRGQKCVVIDPRDDCILCHNIVYVGVYYYD